MTKPSPFYTGDQWFSNFKPVLGWPGGLGQGAPWAPPGGGKEACALLTSLRWCCCCRSRPGPSVEDQLVPPCQGRQQPGETHGMSAAFFFFNQKLYLGIQSKPAKTDFLEWAKSAWLLHLEIGLALGPPDKLWQPLGHRFFESPSFRSGKCCRIHQSQLQDSGIVTLGGKHNFCSASDLNLVHDPRAQSPCPQPMLAQWWPLAPMYSGWGTEKTAQASP